MMRGLPAAAVASLLGLCVLTSGDTAAQASEVVPQVGSTLTTTCRFVASTASTDCRHETVSVSDGHCYSTGRRLYLAAHIDSSRSYRGNAVLPGLDGVAVEGSDADPVRPNALVVDDSGPHAYSEGITVDDPACP